MSFLSEISFTSESISFDIENEEIITNWITNVIKSENKVLGELAYVFCSDDYLLKINIEHLNHDTYTDVITFNYCEDNIVSGDIFISIDRVKENAIEFLSTFQNELNRVMIHGVLHLIGYNDKSPEQQLQMTGKEDFYLSLL